MQIVFLIWGIGILLPWNAVLTTYDFFEFRMDGFNPSFTYGFAVNGVLFVMQFIIIIFFQGLS